MPTAKVYPNGMTTGSAGHNPSPEKRGRVTGWTAATVRRHTGWLYSIESTELDGRGIALTLTMLRTPESAVEFHRLRSAWIKRVQRLGALRIHWVIEWQKRGTPHLHCAIYFPEQGVGEAEEPEARAAGAAAPASTLSDDDLAAACIVAWINVAGEYGVSPFAQWYDDIDGPIGWLKYLSKHAARGVKHYQRAGKPAGWESSGRLWGYGGEWPAVEPIEANLSRPAYWRLRRLIRSWAIAGARADLLRQLENPVRDPGEQAERLRKARARVKWTRGMLACSNRRLAPVRGVSQWCPEDVTTSLLMLIESENLGVLG